MTQPRLALLAVLALPLGTPEGPSSAGWRAEACISLPTRGAATELSFAEDDLPALPPPPCYYVTTPWAGNNTAGGLIAWANACTVSTCLPGACLRRRDFVQGQSACACGNQGF